MPSCLRVIRDTGAGQVLAWVAPGAVLPVRQAEGAADMRWGMIPPAGKTARGRPILQPLPFLRAETVFDGPDVASLARGIVRVAGWSERIGAGPGGALWHVVPARGGPFGLAALLHRWRAPDGRSVLQGAVLTCSPTPQLAATHNRMPVLLDPAQEEDWLAGSAPPPLLPPPEGRLSLRRAG